MAIDDNKLYGLTGAQIKELPEKIEAVKGKAKVLTSDDYNWHGTGSVDNKIALWKLEPGLYTVDNSLNASDVLYSMGFSFGNDYTTFIIGNYGSEYLTVFALGYQMNANPNRVMMATIIRKTGQGYSPIRRILTDDVIVNNLTSAVNSYALSAAQGKVLKDLVDSLAIRGAGVPTTSTVGQVGTLYEDTTNGDLYICTDATNPYVWEEVGAGGGGPTVVQTTGTSTTDVMSQNATTSMVYADPNIRTRVQIGTRASASSNGNIAIGRDSSSTLDRGIAIGDNASSSASGAIALGAYSSASTIGVMDVGASTPSYGYNNSNYRLLTGLYDPQNAHDAANKQYVDSAIAALEARVAALEGN